jgi:cytochrome c-type biogenesis protein CcmH/NrfG
MEQVKAERPRNQLGQPATTTPEETIARLREKVAKNHGGAKRKRIQAQISEELGPKVDAC